MANSSLFNPNASKYFRNYDYTKRQDMIDNFIISAIKQNGMSFKYIPKDNFVRDEVFGDDTFAKYEEALTLAGYIKNTDSFDGQGDMFSRFGFQISDSITVTISKKQWFDFQTVEYQPTDSSELRSQPLAGDLVWFPVMDKIFEINHVERNANFFTFGKLYTFELQCELYKYNQDEFKTGFDAIDEIDTMYNTDTLQDIFTTQNGIDLVTESGEPILSEEYKIENKDDQANNTLFEDKSEDVIDFNERGPFTLGSGKW